MTFQHERDAVPGHAGGDAATSLSGLDRRRMIGGMIAVLTGVPLGGVLLGTGRATAADAAIDRAGFLALSTKLCEFPVRGNNLADAIAAAVVEAHPPESLAKLAALLEKAAPGDVDRLLAGSPLAAVAKTIMTVWYSGRAGEGAKARIITHEDALAWRATGFAKAPGTCGAFGDWGTAPVEAATAATSEGVIKTGGGKP